MKVEQIYTGCLAKAAYYIESKGEAVIIDPRRNTDNYIELAKTNSAKIKYILETHFNPILRSSLISLTKQTDAVLVYGPTSQPNLEAHIAKDDEELKFGDVTIKVLHTPGQSMEATSYLLKDEKGKDYAIFTGDALLFGKDNRSKFENKEKGIDQRDLAGMLYKSLRNKILPLADNVIIYSSYSGGSACGKKIFNDRERTLGNLKKVNYLLRPEFTKNEFINEKTSNLVNVSHESAENKIPKKRAESEENNSPKKGNITLNLRAFKAAWEMEEALVLDTRNKEKFVKGFVPGSIFMGIDGSFSDCVASLINDLYRPILFIAETGREEEVTFRLKDLGYSNIIGYLDGGFEAWKKAKEQIDKVEEVNSIVFAELYKRKNLNVLDVRKKGERHSYRFDGVEKFPLDGINKNMNLINLGEKHYLHCKNGYRSLIAVSILKARGIHDVVHVKEGFNELSRLYKKRTTYKKQVYKI